MLINIWNCNEREKNNLKKVREVSHIYYIDEDGKVEIKDRADGIEKGINKGVKKFRIVEETEWEVLS
jgi:hypothetical protein